MLKTHAEKLRVVIRRKESHHNPDMKVTIEGTGPKSYRVVVEANEALINDMTSDHSSHEYNDGAEHTRHRLSATKVEFV